jgi:hypothetical protein
VYFGLSAGLQLLDVAFFSLVLLRNEFTRCSVFANLNEFFASGGNVYGGGVSVYMGGYSSSISFHGDAVAAVGDTAVRNASVRVGTASFTSCSATTAGIFGANSYGGSFSVYIGAYTWSSAGLFLGSSLSPFASSVCGTTNVTGLVVSISSLTFANSISRAFSRCSLVLISLR